MRALLLASIVGVILPIAANAQSAMGTAPVPSAPGGSQVMPSEPAAPNPSLSSLDPVDSRFIRAASSAGLAEVQDGQLAEHKGGPAVQKIGATMVTDHTKVNNQLIALATRKGITIAPAVIDTDAALTTKLSGLSGSAFDAEYLHTQLKAHKAAIALFKMEATDGADENLKAFAATTLPTLQMHLQMIETAVQ